MGLSIKDWKFLRDLEVGLRHIGDHQTAAVQMTEGMNGDAVPLSTAAEIIERERTCGNHSQISMFAGTRKMFETISNNAEEFEQRLRDKIEQVVSVGFNNNMTGDLRQSVFMLVTGIGKSYSNTDYEVHPDTYPLGKAGKQPIKPGQIATAFTLTADDQQAIADGTKTAVGIIVDKVMDAIPALREKLAPDNTAENSQRSKFTADDTAPKSDWSIESVVKNKAREIESWFGGKGIDTLKTGEKALATLSLHAQQFIDGAIPDGKMKDEAAQFAKTMKTLIEHDAQTAVNFSISVLRHPKLAGLAETAGESYKDAMNALKSTNFEQALNVAKDHMQAYGGVAAIATVATAIAMSAAPAPVKQAVSLARKAL